MYDIKSSGITLSLNVINLSNIDKTNPFMIYTKNTELREYNLIKIRIRMYQEHSITNMIVISYAFNAVNYMGDEVFQERHNF